MVEEGWLDAFQRDCLSLYHSQRESHQRYDHRKTRFRKREYPNEDRDIQISDASFKLTPRI